MEFTLELSLFGKTFKINKNRKATENSTLHGCECAVRGCSEQAEYLICITSEERKSEHVPYCWFHGEDHPHWFEDEWWDSYDLVEELGERLGLKELCPKKPEAI